MLFENKYGSFPGWMGCLDLQQVMCSSVFAVCAHRALIDWGTMISVLSDTVLFQNTFFICLLFVVSQKCRVVEAFRDWWPLMEPMPRRVRSVQSMWRSRKKGEWLLSEWSPVCRCVDNTLVMRGGGQVSGHLFVDVWTALRSACTHTCMQAHTHVHTHTGLQHTHIKQTCREVRPLKVAV